MPKRKPTTDLNALLGTAGRSSQIRRPSALDEPERQFVATPMFQNTETQEHALPQPPMIEPPSAPELPIERRINVAIRESIHKPLKLHAVKTDREVRDVVELALRAYLEAHGEL